VPVALEDVLREKAAATGAEAHGSRGKAIDVCAVQERVLQLLFGQQVGRCATERSQQADLTDLSFLRPFSLATELQCGNPLLTPWGHEISPLVSGRVVGLSKGEHCKRQGLSTADIGGVKELPRQRLT
jgi:hypothetical protein